MKLIAVAKKKKKKKKHFTRIIQIHNILIYKILSFRYIKFYRLLRKLTSELQRLRSIL